MRQVVQGLSGGQVRLVEVPIPIIKPTEVLVETLASIVSSGTEKMITQLAQSNLLEKAKARPDLVKQVLRKAKQDGPLSTLKTVRSKLNSDIPLGYSACGMAREVGEYVVGIQPGDLVATGGAGHANHADFQAVPGLLCTKVPPNVSISDAAFSTIASISLHALRLGEIQPGSNIGIIGLGLIGQLAAKLAIASGASVFGIDIDEAKVELLSRQGSSAVAYLEKGNLTSEAILDATRGTGLDCVLITAGGKTNLPLKRTPEILRDRGVIVIVGDVAVEAERTPLYNKEITIKVARSYGPGRYDRSYEEWGVDYPTGFVRFTEGRNMETVINLLSGNKISFQDLISESFEIDNAEKAYSELNSSKDILGILFTYGKKLDRLSPTVGTLSKITIADTIDSTNKIRDKFIGNNSAPIRIGLIGAGNYTISTLIPTINKTKFGTLYGVVSSTGISANRVAENTNGVKVFNNYKELLNNDSINTVFIATPHSSHAQIASDALAGGKHVWCEKPLALSRGELELIYTNLADSILFVGFNRRFSPAIQRLKRHFETKTLDASDTNIANGGSLTITYRVATGRVPLTHWYHDRREGGRLLGEVCHFIDTCSAIVGLPVSSLNVFGSGFEERILSDNIAVSLSFEDGSVAVITYSVNGHSATSKERIEVLGRGKSAVIDDFRSIELDGRKEMLNGQDKGQANALMEFKTLIESSKRSPSWVNESSHATILAAEQLLLN